MHYRTSDTYNVPKVRLYDLILIYILFLYKIMMYYQILEYIYVLQYLKRVLYRSTRTVRTYVVQMSDVTHLSLVST